VSTHSYGRTPKIGIGYSPWNTDHRTSRRNSYWRTSCESWGFSIEHSYDTATILVDAVFYLVITIIQIVAELADVMLLSPDLRAAEKDLKELVADYHFLQEHGIHTVADLQANIERSKSELSALERERSDINNRIR